MQVKTYLIRWELGVIVSNLICVVERATMNGDGSMQAILCVKPALLENKGRAR